MNKKLKIGFTYYVAIVLMIILFDQMLKLYAYNYMSFSDSKDIPFLSPFLQLTYKLNHGIITGYIPKLKNWKIYFLIVKIITICILVSFTYYEYKHQNTFYKNVIMIFSAFIVGGAISNTIDWVFYSKYLSFTYNYDNYHFFGGSVIDVLKFPFLDNIKIYIPLIGKVIFLSPIFNIADFFIIVGSIASFFIYLTIINSGKKDDFTETSLSQQNSNLQGKNDNEDNKQNNNEYDNQNNNEDNKQNNNEYEKEDA